MREAQNARNNRAEIVRALSQGQVTRRELMKWGIFTSAGALVLKNGLSPFAPSAFAKGSDIPTGTPASPLFGAQPFTQAMPRLATPDPIPMIELPRSESGEIMLDWTGYNDPNQPGYEMPARRLSYHTDFVPPSVPGDASSGSFVNPLTARGPIEGRPPGEYFAHQRWEEYLPKVGYRLSLGQIHDAASMGTNRGIYFHPDMPDQDKNSVWTFETSGRGGRGLLPPLLIKGRYGEPMVTRIYNNLPVGREDNNGFGRNEPSIHFHNAHNASGSDGASNAFHFPGTFYDYHWTTTLARADKINRQATNAFASGPDGNGDVVNIPGDWREIQGTMWAHDHRFFFTAENVYKGYLMMVNYYSGRDRGNEVIDGGYRNGNPINLKLPSGWVHDSGNVDFDVNLIISDYATDQDGQLFFDIFNTDGFLGDQTLVNFAWKPYMDVLPRKYRFRLLSAGMSRFWQFCLVDNAGKRVPFHFIANDGNLLERAVRGNLLDVQGVAERYDIIVDFSQVEGDTVWLVNTMQHKDGRGPDRRLGHIAAMNGQSDDPAVGAVLKFNITGEVESADAPGTMLKASEITDTSFARPRARLTKQIPIVEPVRTRHVEWVRSNGDSNEAAPGGGCIPECLLDGQPRESFPWSVRVNGEEAHSMNANRISNLIPRPGEIEHWTYANGGGGWDHPIHLHYEEGITMHRGDDSIPDTEYLVRKDVWRLREGGSVTFQVQFGEFGGAYVNHCHNTVHEDFAMLMRYDVLLDGKHGSALHSAIIPTPNPTPDGVFYTTPEVQPEGDPDNHPEFFFQTELEELRSKTRKV